MAIDKRAWEPEERAEYDALLEVVVGGSKNTHERLDAFERLLDDAVQAHRRWAIDVDRAARRSGLAKEITKYERRTAALVSHDGQVLNLPGIQARRVTDVGGDVYYQHELIELWTWQEIAEKRAEALQGQRTYSAKMAHYDRLLALHELAPDAATPAEAAKVLGITVEGWLGGEVGEAA